MGRPAYFEVAITTDASENATVYTPVLTGRLRGIKYMPGASGLDTGADLAITGNRTGLSLLTKADAGTSTVWFHPLAAGCKATDGSASSTYEPLFLAGEEIKVVVAQGGDTKSGAIGFLVELE